jgi:hypothetical protein
MEHLHVLIDGIDNLKQYLTDNEYLKLMMSISKLEEIINSNNDSDDSDENYSDNEEENEEDDENEECNIIEITKEDNDLISNISDTNEKILINFIKENNLPEDFINSTFSIYDVSAVNYIAKKTCKCMNDNDMCDEEVMNCKNFQKIILRNPLTYITCKQYNEQYVDKIISDINKYNLFSFDGKINTNELEIDECNIKLIISKNLKMFDNIRGIKYRTLQFLNIFHIIYNTAYHLLIKHDNFKQAVYNKLINEIGTDENKINEIKYWTSKLNLHPDIISIMISNFKETFNL